MAWPPKIATAKPCERPSPFNEWYYKARAKTAEELPMATELLYRVCGNNPNRFDLVNYWLEEAFNAGRRSK